jgi:ADP-ribose pyrophosphatase YjhB (NUDIX family)
MKEYTIENGEEFDQGELRNPPMEKNHYIEAHKALPIPCHDIFIQYKGGILLVIRDNVPAKGELWCIGGRVKKGFNILDSLKDKTREECNLEIKDIKFLGVTRHYWKTDPFGHRKGTDNISFTYAAKGEGDLKLDNLHKDPIIVKPSNYSSIRPKLHPYMQDFMDKAMELINE